MAVPVGFAAHVPIASNNQSALQQMCEQGLGRLAHADVLPALARGALVAVAA